MQYKKDIRCSQCEIEISSIWDVFPGSICLNCHAIAFDKKNEQEKQKDFKVLTGQFKNTINM